MHQPDIIEFRRIRNIPEILNVTFDFIRQNFRLFWRSLLFLAFPPIAVGVTVFGYFFITLFETALRDGAAGEVGLPILVAVTAGGILCGSGTAVLIGLVHVFAELYRERGPNGFTVEDVWRGTKEIFWMLFWTLIGLEICGTVIGVLAVLIPFGQLGLYAVATFAAFYFPLRIYNRRGFLQSVIVSSKLVEGRWWATFGMLLLFGLLTFGLTGVFTIPLYLFIWAETTGMIDVDALGNSALLLRLLGTALVSAYTAALFLLGTIPLLSMIFHYHSQRERKEGVGLLEAVEQIGAAEEAT